MHAVIEVLGELGVLVEVGQMRGRGVFELLLFFDGCLFDFIGFLLLLELIIEVLFHLFDLMHGMIHGLDDVVGAAEA